MIHEMRYTKCMNTLSEMLQKKPYLTWYLANKTQLSEKSILEHILNYGDWDDYLLTQRTFGIQKTKQLFEEMLSGHRINLRQKTIAYFSRYFTAYAS